MMPVTFSRAICAPLIERLGPVTTRAQASTANTANTRQNNRRRLRRRLSISMSVSRLMMPGSGCYSGVDCWLRRGIAEFGDRLLVFLDFLALHGQRQLPRSAVDGDDLRVHLLAHGEAVRALLG